MIAALALIHTLVAASPSGEERARELFHAGVEAYRAGKFIPAAQAFLEAHQLIAKPQLLFSAAQAFRREFDAEQDETHRRLAIRYYRDYLAQVKEGGRRYDAARALGELRALELDGVGSPEIAFSTRVSVTSPVTGATASIDGGVPLDLPYQSEIEPGPHRVVIAAAGYFDRTHEFVAEAGRIAPIDIALEGRAPTMAISGGDGAVVAVDGREIGELPFSQPIEVPAGRHFVVVKKSGHEPYGAEMEFSYGLEQSLGVELEMTDRRRLAFGAIGVGVAAFASGGVVGGLAFAEQSRAKTIERALQAGAITEARRLQHNRALERRDGFRTASLATAGAGVLIIIGGLLLYAFDDPGLPRSPPPPPAIDPEQSAPPDVEVIGMSFGGRF